MIKKAKTITDSNMIKDIDSAMSALESKYGGEYIVELEMDGSGIIPVLKFYKKP